MAKVSHSLIIRMVSCVIRSFNANIFYFRNNIEKYSDAQKEISKFHSVRFSNT
jgi:hypothetical protein